MSNPNKPLPEGTEDYLRAFFQDISPTESTTETLSNESRFIPLFKRVLRKFGLGGSDPDNLGDDEAQQIKDSVRIGNQLITGTPYFPPDPTLLDRICPTLTRVNDDLSDAFTIATTIASFPAVLGIVSTPLGYALISFTLVRLGVRAVCSRRTGQ